MRSSTGRITILDRYLFREFALAFLGVIAFCSLLVLIALIFDKFQDIIENETPVWRAIEFFVCTLPTQVLQIVPIAAMLAVLFAVGALARNNEVLACLTNGVSSLRLAVPIAFGGLLIFVGMFVVSEKIAPPLQQRANYIGQRYIEAKSDTRISTEREVFAHGNAGRLYLMDSYVVREKRMVNPQIYDMNEDRSGIVRRIEADSATHIGGEQEEGFSRWQFPKARVWKFDGAGNIVSFQNYDKGVILQLEDDLPTILAQRKKPEEMNFGELRRYVETLKARGQPHYEMVTDLVLKVTFPMGVLAVLIIGFSYAVRTRAGTAMSAIGYGITWAVSYYILTAVLRAFGHSGSLSPFLAGTVTLGVFAVVAAHYFRRSYRWHA